MLMRMIQLILYHLHYEHLSKQIQYSTISIDAQVLMAHYHKYHNDT